MINNNSKNIDKGKTEKLREMIIEDLKDCGGRISIIPLLGFNKWIEIIYLIKNDLKANIIEFEYFLPIKFKKIREIINYNKNIPFWLEFLISADLLENLTNPIVVNDLLVNEFKRPEIIFNEIVSFRQKTVMISSFDPLENVKDFLKYIILPDLDLDKLYNPRKEYDLENDSIEIDGKKYQVVNGYLFNYYPPQIFLCFQKNYNMYFRFIKGIPNNEIIFKKKLQGKYFILWRLNHLFIEFKFPDIDNLTQFINLFLFYIRLFDDGIYILEPIQRNKEKILISEQNEIILASEMFTTYIFATKGYDPKKYDFYKRYWHLDTLESSFHYNSIKYHKSIFDEAFNFSTHIYPNINLRNYILRFFESLCYFQKKELDHCLISLWYIIEKCIDQKWEDVIEEINNEGLPNKKRDKLKNRMYSYSLYTLSSKIDLLFSFNLIDINHFTLLREINNVRNKLIHDFIIPSKKIVLDLINFILRLFKTDFIKILNPLIPKIETKLKIESIFPNSKIIEL